MPRPLRIHFPDVPLHVVQRGHNRMPCFFDDADYRHYLSLLDDGLTRAGVRLHAYVLMTNHVHLLLTPSTAEATARAVISVSGRYVRYVNAKYGRVGTLWDGRYRSSLIQTEGYLFACHRYIELNPVRAGMVTDAADYRWGSYRYHAFGVRNSLIVPNMSYLALGESDAERQSVYREACGATPDERTLADLRGAINHGKPFGDSAFVRGIECATSGCSTLRPRGRPRKPRQDETEKSCLAHFLG